MKYRILKFKDDRIELQRHIFGMWITVKICATIEEAEAEKVKLEIETEFEVIKTYD